MNIIPNDELLAHYLSGECSDDEIEIVNRWIESNANNRRLMETMKKVWNSPEAKIRQLDKANLWKKIKAETGIDVSRDSGRRKYVFGSVWFKAAAVFLIAFSVYYFSSSVLRPVFVQVKLLSMEKTVVENASREKLELADGTKVTLDAGSKLYYDEFSGETREVYLEGEGLFEVSRNADKPFIVHANEGKITVLGTKFGIRAWEQTKKVCVVVVEGEVSLAQETSEENNKVIITKSQMSVLEKDKEPSVPLQVDTDKYLGWINNEIEFDDAPLSEMIGQLERWYNLKITLSKEDLLSERLTVHIQKRPVEETLDLIAVLTETKYKRSGNKVTFTTINE